jgi:DNA transposition AAA+ family ATPase
MTKEDKIKIKEKLSEYCDRIGSQNKAANTLNGVSSATISKLLNDEWDLITEAMFRNIATQIGCSTKEWVIVETRDFKLLTGVLEDAQSNSLVMAVIGEAGCGKSAVSKAYKNGHINSYYLSCNEFWNKKLFMQELLRSMGGDGSGLSIGEMMDEVVKLFNKAENPLLIMDEADKLTDQVLYFFITLYNNMEDNAGIVLLATDHLEKRIKRGLRLNKKGYKEIYSRLGRRFISLKGAGKNDITAVCIANGVTDKADINQVIDDSDCDLRRVKRKCHAVKKSKSN